MKQARKTFESQATKSSYRGRKDRTIASHPASAPKTKNGSKGMRGLGTHEAWMMGE